MAEVLAKILNLILSGIGFSALIYSFYLWKKNREQSEELRHIRDKKWHEDIDEIRKHYSDSTLQSVVDESNDEWDRRKDSNRK